MLGGFNGDAETVFNQVVAEVTKQHIASVTQGRAVVANQHRLSDLGSRFSVSCVRLPNQVSVCVNKGHQLRQYASGNNPNAVAPSESLIHVHQVSIYNRCRAGSGNSYGRPVSNDAGGLYAASAVQVSIHTPTRGVTYNFRGQNVNPLFQFTRPRGA